MLLPTDDRSFSVKSTPVSDAVQIALRQQVPDPRQLAALIAKAEHQAKEWARKAQDQIDDWLTESQWHAEVRRVIEDASRLGTGVLKGPVPVLDKATGQIKPKSFRVDPRDIFPDPACGESVQDGAFVFERDLLTAKQVRELRGGTYIDEQLNIVLTEGPQRRNTDGGEWRDVADTEKFEVWHFHGEASIEQLQSCGCDTEDLAGEYVPVFATLINDRIVRAAPAALEDGSYPYDFIPWQRLQGLPWGAGIAAQVKTPQRMLNAATRNMLDNAGLSAGPQIIFNKGMIHPADGRMELLPRKLWYVTESSSIDDVRKAITSINIPSMQGELMGIIEFSLKMAEESTGLPMLMQGQQGKAPDTLGGMQMLFNSANTVLRRFAKLFDDNITEPHVTRYYQWLKQYGEMGRGEAVIDARGSSALVERDIQSQAIIQMGQMVMNPAFGIDPRKWFEEMAKSQHLDPQRFMMDEEQLKQRQAAAAKQQQQGDPRAQSSLQVAQIRSQADLQKAELNQRSDMAELQFKAQEAEKQRQHEAAMRQADMQLKIMEFAERRNQSLEQVKKDLFIHASDARTKKELFSAEAQLKNQMGSGI
jgi:hypothetical protein